MKKIMVIGLVLATLAGAGFWWFETQGQKKTGFATMKIRRGHIEATVGSTGTLQPREIVDVGAQVVGRIIAIGRDSTTQSKIVDWGSEVKGPVVDQYGKVVKPGTLLAEIDPDLYQAQVLSAEASVSSTQAMVKSAEAAVEVAQADLKTKTATMNQATKDWDRASKLIVTQGVAQAEYDQYEAVFETAKANLKSSQANIGVAEANLKKAQADVHTAEANLKTARTNLAYTKITSPVDGTVIDRRVNVGQTVVASLSAPSLFLIAKDLNKTEVWATVNEVDVGKIKVDPNPSRKNVTFTVDAFPGRTFHGRVVPQGKLPYRLNATMNQNVVTYTVVVSVDEAENRDETQKLRPYMTANLTFLVGEKDNVLMVPNSALRWKPARNQIAPEQRADYAKLMSKKRGPTDAEGQDHGLVWVKRDDDNFVRFVEIRTGMSDSVNTQVVAVTNGELAEGASVIVGETRGGEARGNEASPFVGSPFSPKKKD